MNTILLALGTFLALHTTHLQAAHAAEYSALNFHQDNRIGQFNTVMTIKMDGKENVIEQKICFPDEASRHLEKKPPEGCTFTKTVDTVDEYRIESNCPSIGASTYIWKRISENEFVSTIDSRNMSTVMKYTYVGKTCDPDAKIFR